jgi:hypothetical protein
MPECHGFEAQWGNWIFSIYLVLLAALVLWFTQPPTDMSSRDSIFKCFLQTECGWCRRLTTSPFVSLLCRQCGILNIWPTYRPPWPVTGIAYFLLLHYHFIISALWHCHNIVYNPMWFVPAKFADMWSVLSMYICIEHQQINWVSNQEVNFLHVTQHLMYNYNFYNYWLSKIF